MKSQNIIYLCWFLILGMTAFVTAQQNPAPMPASSASYVKYKNKFYVMGGTVMPEFKSTEGYSAQFFVLDLSKPWKSESPAWTPLPAGFRVSDVGAAMSQDGKIFITFPGFGQAAHRFFFENNTWSASQADLRDSMYSSCPVSLPNGTVFVVGGDERGDNVPVDIYSFNADQTVTTRYPKAALLNSTFEQYKAVWSEYLQSVVYYGGWDILADQSVRLYHPESKQWKKLKTTGGKNVTLVGHCIAITDDGRRILSYGGYDIANWGKFYFSDLEILDLETGNWTTGTSENIQRGYTACTVAGDYFLVWGGSVRFEGPQHVFDINKPSTPVSLYQISKNRWVDEYLPSPEYMDPNPPTSTSTTPSTPEPTNRSESDHISDNKPVIGAIAGGSAGAVVVIALVGFLVWRQRRQRAARSRQKGDPSSQDDHNIPADDKREYHTIVGERPPTPPHHTTSSRSPQDARDPGFVGINVNRGQYYGKEVNPYATMHSNPPLAPTFTTAHTHHYPSEDVNVNRGYAANGSLYYPGTTTASSGDRTASGANSHSTSPHFPPPPTWSFDYAPPPPPPALLLAAPQILPQTHALHGVDHRREVQ